MITKRYIKMCMKSEEIQNINRKEEVGDYIYCPDQDEVFVNAWFGEKGPDVRHRSEILLPKVEQYLYWGGIYMRSVKIVNSVDLYVVEVNDVRKFVEENLLEAFIQAYMFAVHNKYWNDDKEEWIFGGE